MTTEEPIIHAVEFYITERFDSVLYPLDVRSLIDRLPEHGWVVPKFRVEEEAISYEGPPTRGNTRLRLDTGNKTLGVSGNTISEVLSGFRELRELAMEGLELAPGVRSQYTELRYRGWVSDGSNPVEILTSWWASAEQVSQLGRFLGGRLPGDAERLTQYGIKFAPTGQDPNRANWVELSIQPVNYAGNQRYSVELLFRHADTTRVEQVAEEIEELLTATLERLQST